VLPPTTILVTGGTGLIGRSIVRRLIAAAHSVRIMSRACDATAPAGAAIVRGDVTSAADLAAALRGCDAVMHCAAERHDPAKMQAVNVAATRLLFDLARDLQVRLFCHLSSVAVIGRTNARVVDESTPCNPMNRYGETKLAGEAIVNCGLAGGGVVILRPTNVFGAQTVGSWTQRSVGARVRQCLIGRANAHLVYVEDVAAAAVHWLQAPARKAVDTFIVSSDEESGGSYRELHAELALMLPGTPRPPTICAPAWAVTIGRLMRRGDGNRSDLVYSSSKLRAAGFRMPYGLRNGLAEAASQWRSR
jgi:nucleoside-diphosphate-sugar epimerase